MAGTGVEMAETEIAVIPEKEEMAADETEKVSLMHQKVNKKINNKR